MRIESDCRDQSLSLVIRCLGSTSILLLALLMGAFPRTGLGQDPASTQTVFALVGDSTVTRDFGWGLGFEELLSDRADCLQMAQSGRSSRSYRAEGWWQQVLDAKPDYVLIQFGHNDQPGKGVDRESDAATDFRDHLRSYVLQARQAGIHPVLVTSLTRRNWNSDGLIQPSLQAYAEATIAVAQELEVPVLDLHGASIRQCESIGALAFRALEPMTLSGADHTHLNEEGSRVVGALVAELLLEQLPELETCFVHSKIDAAKTPQHNASSLSTGELSLQLDERSLQIRVGDRGLLSYCIQSPEIPQGVDSIYARSGILHPIHTPSGRVVTAAFPIDHPHQHGVFSAWVQTRWNGRSIDFWNLAKGEGRVLHQRVVSTFVNGERIGFEVDLVHRAEQMPVVDVLRERWKVTVSPVTSGVYVFELETTQTALTTEPLKILEYHYGGIAFRGPVAWVLPSDPDPFPAAGEERMPSRFLNDLGADRIEGNAQHARWVALSGELEGSEVCVVVGGHPDNFRAPQATRLHPTKPYFAFSPCVDGEFVIDRQQPYHARFLYLISDQAPAPEWIETIVQQHWSQ